MTYNLNNNNYWLLSPNKHNIFQKDIITLFIIKMRIDIQFKNETFSLQSSPSNFKELVQIIKDMFVPNLRETTEIQYFEEIKKEWGQLDGNLYKSLIETTQNLDRIKLRMIDQISEDSFSLILNNKDYETPDFDNYQEKAPESKFIFRYKLKKVK